MFSDEYNGAIWGVTALNPHGTAPEQKIWVMEPASAMLVFRCPAYPHTGANVLWQNGLPLRLSVNDLRRCI